MFLLPSEVSGRMKIHRFLRLTNDPLFVCLILVKEERKHNYPSENCGHIARKHFP